MPIDVAMVSLDPALVSDNQSIDAIQNTFEGLVASGEDSQIHPCLASSWEISSDGATYTFHLLHGAFFQNGREFVADDVRKSFERACGKALAAPLASDFLSDISGMAAYRNGKAKSISGIHVIDRYTVAITIDTLRAYFLAKLALPVASIVATEAIRDGVHIRSVEEMVGTGPFRIERYIDGQLMVQKAFARYHGGKPPLDEIDRPVMRDSAERLNAFKRHEIDMVPQLARSDYVALRNDPAFKDQLHLEPRATLVYLALNVKDFPDRRVRQAIAIGIDREEIASDTLYGTVTPGRGLLPPGVPGYREEPAWLKPDAVKAEALLSASGHSNGVGVPEIPIAFSMENPDIERIAERIGAQLASRLGLKVRLEKMETASLIARQNGKQLQAEVTGWFADYLDPEDFLSVLLASDATENHWNYANTAFTFLCREADASGNDPQRLGFYARAEDIALQDAVIIPICYWKAPVLIDSAVQGVRSDASHFLPYTTVSLRRKK
ncbi:MAG TPA: ABC transporter substrate-binding protein [Fimbriimonadaceae bacterium]|nr:ABC transporter substrate-binding protein [Fimbriimonadaceae bacterium]